ncbi:mitochondrial substrate carrier protein [Klebsormidium nitens]|uniref:Mitochondrial substrate carrier protein n=1 Tax=Klebsormidium nitens TaxID=105231 RepID=A0A1Y1HZR5_KLENI|nr:mitochondrial substrate carrier protein [Klebsormidium nitens]|eukprot:GAQ81348.1 mitochondrial substrate carrier protein [Klebsormidium nitens]
MSHPEPGDGSEEGPTSADDAVATLTRDSSPTGAARRKSSSRASVVKSEQSTVDAGGKPWWAFRKQSHAVRPSTESALQRSNVLAKFIRSAAETEVEPPAVLRRARKPGFLKKLPPWQDALAGATAGLGSTLLLHPLDVIKTRLQVQDGAGLQIPKYRGTFHAFRSILQNEGGRALYGGLGPAILGSSISWGIYFSYYSGAKRRYQRWTGRKELSAPLHLLAAGEAGVVCAICTNPIWVLKTRLQIQEKLRVAAGQQLAQTSSLIPYRGTYDAFWSILREEGVQGFYRGLVPSLLLVSHGALQFMAYEEMRKLAVKARSVNSHRPPSGGSGSGDSELKAVDFASIGAASKLFATVVTYPTQVIRSRLQQRPGQMGHKYRNGWHALRELLKNEGARGLYKGFVPNVLRVMPSSAITFVLYESLMRVLKQREKS